MSASGQNPDVEQLGMPVDSRKRNFPVRFTSIMSRATCVARVAQAFAFAALILLAGTERASAATTVERQETRSAHLATGAGELEIISPDKSGGVSACLVVYAADGTVEEGCTDVTGTLAVDKHLTSATLSPTAIDLNATVCDGKSCDLVFTRTVVVAAAWTAAGPFERVHELLYNGGPDDPCQTDIVITGRYQPATGTLSIDGVDGAGSGDLQEIVDVQRRSCR